jgi:Spy/CpxP family protein refolding chaperone
MKKYVIVMLAVLMASFFVLPLTMKAEEEKAGMEMKGHEESMTPMKEMHHDWLSSLNLDEKVTKKIQEIKLAHKEKMIELKSQLERKELEFEKVLLEKELDFNKLLAVHDEISVLKQKIERKMLEQKIEMYKLIPDDKKEEARKMFLHKFSRPEHEGKPGGSGKPGCPMKK